MLSKKIISFSLLLLLFLVNVHLAFSMHYCGGELMSVAVNSAASACCETEDNCCCCETKVVELGGCDDAYLQSTYTLNKVSLEDIFSAPALPISFFVSIPASAIIGKTFLCFESPPPLLRQRLALFQSYLC